MIFVGQRKKESLALTYSGAPLSILGGCLVFFPFIVP